MKITIWLLWKLNDLIHIKCRDHLSTMNRTVPIQVASAWIPDRTRGRQPIPLQGFQCEALHQHRASLALSSHGNFLLANQLFPGEICFPRKREIQGQVVRQIQIELLPSVSQAPLQKSFLLRFVCCLTLFIQLTFAVGSIRFQAPCLRQCPRTILRTQ